MEMVFKSKSTESLLMMSVYVQLEETIHNWNNQTFKLYFSCNHFINL